MLNCVAAIQYNEETKKFTLVSGDNRVEINKTKALEKFVNNAPEISPDILAGLTGVWFPDDDEIADGEYEDVDADIKAEETVCQNP